MRRFFIILAAALTLSAQVKASSLDVFSGYATVTSSNGVLFPYSFFLQAFFYTTAGPITSSTVNGALNQAQNAGTSTQQILVTSTLTGFGPGGGDNPIFTYTVSPGAGIFSFN